MAVSTNIYTFSKTELGEWSSDNSYFGHMSTFYTYLKNDKEFLLLLWVLSPITITTTITLSTITIILSDI